jgi:cullin-associated NEDD8-dissociated protein 1
LDQIFKEVDDGIGNFMQEMKLQGRWDDVAVMSFSEFGRTMTTNGAGTDHGWGSNNFLLGGSVKGGKILGKYPYVLSDESELSLGRGRLIPTTPFEALWNALGEWVGVTPEAMNDLLPNLGNFQANQLFKKEDLFEA